MMLKQCTLHGVESEAHCGSNRDVVMYVVVKMKLPPHPGAADFDAVLRLNHVCINGPGTSIQKNTPIPASSSSSLVQREALL